MLNNTNEKFINCFRDDIAYFFLDIDEEKKLEVINKKENGGSENELFEILVRR